MIDKFNFIFNPNKSDDIKILSQPTIKEYEGSYTAKMDIGIGST